MKVCKQWNDVITDKNRKSNLIWKGLVERKVKNDSNWKGLAYRRGWIEHLYNQKNTKTDWYYRSMFSQAKRDIKRINYQLNIATSIPTRQVFRIPNDDEDDMDDDDDYAKCGSAIEVNENNIFIGTEGGKIIVLDRKDPWLCEDMLETDSQISHLQGWVFIKIYNN